MNILDRRHSQTLCVLVAILGLVVAGFGIYLIAGLSGVPAFISVGTTIAGLLLIVSGILSCLYRNNGLLCWVLLIVSIFLVVIGILAIITTTFVVEGIILIILGIITLLLSILCFALSASARRQDE